MTEGIQQKLLRVRPPKVRITYGVETGGAIEQRELPFIVGILADLSGDRGSTTDLAPEPLKERKMADIDRDNFNDILKAIRPRVDLSKVPQTVAATASLLATPDDRQITFEHIDDFAPMQIIRKLPTLAGMYESRSLVRSLQAKYESDEDLARHIDTLVQGSDPGQQGAMLKLMGGIGAVPEAGRPALRKALLALNDSVGGTAALADKAAEYRKWSLLPAAGATAPTSSSADAAAAFEMGVATAGLNAAALARALAAPDNADNRAKALQLIGQLQLTGAAPTGEGATEEAKAPFVKRDTLLARLGLDPAAAASAVDPALAAVQVDQLKAASAAHSGDALWAKPLLILGLTLADDAAREAFFQFASGIHTGTDPGGEQLAIVAAAAPLLQADAAKNLLCLKHFAKQVGELIAEGTHAEALAAAQKRGTAAAIDELVARIDRLLSVALTAILHSPGFKRVEAAWRGLARLVFNTDTSAMLRLRVFNATRDELARDMDEAAEFDQSMLFRLMYEAGYGTLGGSPYSLLVGGYELGPGAGDIAFLRKISEVAAAAHTPFIAAARTGTSGLGKNFGNAGLTAWRAFRETEASRYVTLVLPRVVLRLPYGKPEKRNTMPCEGVDFEENVSGAGLKPFINAGGEITGYPKPDKESFLWGNAAYLLAERITNAFSLYNWTAAIRGVEGGGLVEDLPLYTYTSVTGSSELFCPIEVPITGRREQELNELGLISLIHCKGSGRAAFFGGQTARLPKEYFPGSANANARIAPMLPYLLAASRFVHYIKAIMRGRIGSFMTRGNVEAFLNGWIANYVLLDDKPAPDARAAFPLRAASVAVTDVPGQPGCYRATIFLKPHFQLEELRTSIRLVADLPG